MLAKFKENLKMIDIFGQQITLSFRQQEQYRTSFGGFLSICIIGIIVSFFYSNIIDFFAKNTVTTTTQLEFSENPEQMVFSLQDFMFAVQVEQDNFNTKPFFNITLEQRLYTRDENGTQVRMPTTYIDLVPCTVEHFKPLFDKYNTSIEGLFKQYTLTNFLCPNLSDPLTQNLTIGGGYLSSKYYFLKFVVSACKNSSSTNSYLSWKPVCQSQEAFDKKLASAGNFRFQLYTTNFLINPNDAHNYIKPYIGVDQFYSFVPNAMFIQSDISFRPKTIVTDEGILMYPNKNTEIIANRDYGDYRQQTAITGLTPGYFGAFYFVRSPYSYTIHRNYMRLAELLSYLGGFAQFMIVILGLFIRFYNREHMIIELANDLYQFDLNKKRENTQLHLSKLLSQSHHGRQKLKKSIKDIQLDSAIQIKSFTTFSQKPIMDQHGTPSAQINESAKNQFTKLNMIKQISKKKICTTKITNSKIFELFKEFMKPKQYIGISLRLILSQILPFEVLKSDECIVIQRAIDQVNKEFDVQFIMKQLHELIKLKKVLFNDEQIQLFNFSQKPKICLLQDRKRKSGNRQSTLIKSIQDISIQEMALSDLFTSLVSAYQKIIGLESEEMTQEQRRFNTRLISLLGAKLPNMIEKELDLASDEDSYTEPKPEDLMSNSP